ncbi:MAG: hypothetical protein SFU98_06285 [Leptospiraceae bacterium]|nr:hypothetical protein [Leptospiraceae bacterium]
MIKKVIDFILKLNFKEINRFYNMKYIPFIYIAFLMIILLTRPNYDAYGYDVLNYGIKILFPIFGVFFFFGGIIDNKPEMLNLHSILAIIFGIVCCVIEFNHPHKIPIQNKKKNNH